MPSGVYERTDYHRNAGMKGRLKGGLLRRTRLKINCVVCGKEFERIPSHIKEFNMCCRKCADKYKGDGLRGRKHSKEALAKMRNVRLGKLNPAWNGGTNTINMSIRGMPEYKEWRLMVFGRDNFTCQKCGIRGTYLEAHHKKPLRTILIKNKINGVVDARLCKELWNIENGMTLCKKCHKNKHRKGKEI